MERWYDSVRSVRSVRNRPQRTPREIPSDAVGRCGRYGRCSRNGLHMHVLRAGEERRLAFWAAAERQRATDVVTALHAPARRATGAAYSSSVSAPSSELPSRVFAGEVSICATSSAVRSKRWITIPSTSRSTLVNAIPRPAATNPAACDGINHQVHHLPSRGRAASNSKSIGSV